MNRLPWDPNRPGRCQPCNGTGVVVVKLKCDLYKCGYTTHATTCNECRGLGRVTEQAPVLDHKLAATGEAR